MRQVFAPQLRIRAAAVGFLVFLLGMVAAPSAQAQQLPLSDFYLWHTRWINPAAMGTRSLNQLMVSHQQRYLNFGGTLRNMSQFLNYSSAPMGRGGVFGWGLFLNHDVFHTERRISVNIALAAQLIKNGSSNLSVGINTGLINWGSTYDKYDVYDRTDLLLSKPTSFAELDAGMGVRYSFSNYFIKSEANLMLSQIPGNMFSKPSFGVGLFPHVLGGGYFLLSPDNNFYIGPSVFYKNTLHKQDSLNGQPVDLGGLVKGQMDIGLKARVMSWGVWAAGGYRIGNSAVTAGFGVKILNPDTLFDQSRSALFMDLNASASYPLNKSTMFGPSIEVGLTLAFGRVGEYNVTVDTLTRIRGSFWKNDGNINTHRVQRLNNNGPTGLQAVTEVEEKKVTLTYTWEDNMYRYLGDNPVVKSDTLLSAVGQEWEGVDGIISNLVTEVIREALHPDTSQVANPDSLEPLKSLILVELTGNLKANPIEADFGAQGAIFAADLPEKTQGDTLKLLVEYDGRDTLVTVYRDKNLSNLELACLKMHVIRKRLEFEINKYLSADMALVWQGAKGTGEERIGGRNVVYLQRPKITSDHPHQKTFVNPEVKLVFTRYQNYFETKAAEKSASGANKEEAKLARERRKRKNEYRDIVE